MKLATEPWQGIVKMAEQNVTCEIVLNDLLFIDPSESLLIFSIVELVFTYTFVIGSLAWWWQNRTRSFLAKRSFPLVCLSGAGVLFLITGTCSQRIFDDLPCEAFAFLYSSAFILTFWPITVRILRVYFRIKYDLALVELVAEEKEFNHDFSDAMQNPRIKALRFRATALAMSLVTVIPIVLDLIAGGFIAVIECNCLLESEDGRFVVLFLIGAIVMLIVNAAVLAYIRGRPDPLRLGRETEVAYAVSAALFFPGALLLRLDPGQFTGRDETPWSWLILVDWSFLVFFAAVGPLPVALSGTPISNQQDASDLKEVLDDETGFKCFTRYLATELSVENVLFFSEVKAWVGEYESADPAARQQVAQEIYDKYFTRSSEFEINVSAMQAEKVHDVFRSGKAAAKDVFTDSQIEVYRLMSADSFPRFKKSSLYKLYRGNLDPEEEDGVVAPPVV